MQSPGSTPFRAGDAALRKRARQHPDVGAVTAGDAAERDMLLGFRGGSVAIDLPCVLRYRRHHLTARVPTTRRMMEGILAMEDKHADALSELLVTLPDDVRRSTHPGGSA